MNSPENLQRTRVKVCGITRQQDLMAAYRAGADAIGLVFFNKSPRAVTAEQANTILNSIPPFITRVGLFVNAEPEFIRSVLDTVYLDVLQFHGEETNNQCVAYDKPFIKAIRVSESTDLNAKIAEYPDTMAILLDSYVKGVKGGTGITFNWNQIPNQRSKPIILAGGLNPENVAKAITQVNPDVVDVSGGVESEPGIKDHNLIKAFIQEVNYASRQSP